jgi:hypothetical protein
MAPIVLFFALTGAAQLFNLHEAHGDYRPPALLDKLRSVHKDQVFAPGHHHEPPEPKTDSQQPAEGAAALASTEDDDDKSGPSTLALKAFFLVVALCLVLSTALGLWMGLTQTRHKRLGWMLLLAGALIPVGLLLL